MAYDKSPFQEDHSLITYVKSCLASIKLYLLLSTFLCYMPFSTWPMTRHLFRKLILSPPMSNHAQPVQTHLRQEHHSQHAWDKSPLQATHPPNNHVKSPLFWSYLTVLCCTPFSTWPGTSYLFRKLTLPFPMFNQAQPVQTLLSPEHLFPHDLEKSP